MPRARPSVRPSIPAQPAARKCTVAERSRGEGKNQSPLRCLNCIPEVNAFKFGETLTQARVLPVEKVAFLCSAMHMWPTSGREGRKGARATLLLLERDG